MNNRIVILAVLLVQGLCAAFFFIDIFVTIFALPVTPINWQLFELIEIGAAIGLMSGVALASVALRRSMRDAARMKSRLRAASGAFMDLLEDSFDEWGLTPAERDVALFAIKGLSTAEIAALRNTSEGTVKAQTNAIFRKADVAGRPQLLSHFIEDLLAGSLEERGDPQVPAKREAV